MLKQVVSVCFGLFFGLVSGQASAVDLGLVSTLVSKLGVTQKQAEGGAGSILGYAQNNLSKDDFSKVATALPETSSLVAAAPQADASGLGALGGGSLGSVAGLASLGGTFQKLGLSSDMVGKFVPVVLDYAQAKGGTAVSGILGKVLNPGAAPAVPAAAAAPAAPAAPVATVAPVTAAPAPTAAATAAPTAKATAPAKKAAKKPAAKKPAPTKAP